MQTWKLDTNVEGKAQQQIKAAEAGQYRLSYKLTDAKKHTIEGGYVFVVRGEGFDGHDFRFNDIELITDKREYAPGDKVKLLINTNRDGRHRAAVRAADQRRLSAAAGAAPEGQEHRRGDRRRAEGHAQLLRRGGDGRRRPASTREIARGHRAAGKARAERRRCSRRSRSTSPARRRR